MFKIKCKNCNNSINLKEIKEGTHAICECGCIQICLECDELISRWKIAYLEVENDTYM